MWSMGVVSYAMLCGSTPWVDDEAEKEELISAGRPRYCARLFGALSASAQDFVQSLLQVKEQQRLTAEDALAHRWICAGTPQAKPQQLECQQYPKILAKEDFSVSRSTEAGSEASYAAHGDVADADDFQ